MLPDFPKVRSYAGDFLRELFEKQLRRRPGLMRDVGLVVMHEGHRMSLRRSDGSYECKSMRRLGSKISLRRGDLEKKGLGAVLEALTKTAMDMAQKQEKFFLQRVNEILEEAGQVVDAQGRPLTFDLFLKTLERIDIDFDERGQPQMPTLVCGTAAFEKIKKWGITDEQKRRFGELVERKRLAWRDREGDRRLVG